MERMSFVKNHLHLLLRKQKTLIDLAKKKNLFLFEAITTLHLPNYKKIKEMIEFVRKDKISSVQLFSIFK